MPLPPPATLRAFAIALLIALASSIDASAKRKDDRLVLENGDQLTGEIKKLEQGTLSFKADYMLSAMDVDWRRVQALQSQDEYQVVLASGLHVTGTIERRPDGSFTISSRSGGAPMTYDWSDVLGMLPVEASFWNQLTGNLDSGFSYTSGDSQTQFSASGTLGYFAERYSVGFSGSSTFSGQESGTSTTRNTIEAIGQINVRPKWYTLGLVTLLSSEQQDLNLRTTLGGAVGRWLMRTDHTSLTLYGGIAYNHEEYAVPPDPSQPGSEVTDNIEGLIGSSYSFVRFKSTNIVSRFTLFPGLTTLGRVRLQYAPTLNLEIANNLYWSFTLYENYDSKPPVNANKNDFGVTNSLGWKF